MEGVGLDTRISPFFLNSGLGFGGSCFPKDVKALIGKAADVDYEPLLLKTVLLVNDHQPQMLLRLLKIHVPDLKASALPCWAWPSRTIQTISGSRVPYP